MASAYKKQARASLKTLAGISIFSPDFFNRLRLGSTVWPAWWYCVHIIVNITDPIKAVVHIRSPPLRCTTGLENLFVKAAVSFALCSPTQSVQRVVVAQPTVIVSAALSFLSPENLLLPCVLLPLPPAFPYTARGDKTCLGLS